MEAFEEEPPEHRRFAEHLRALDAVAEADEAELVAAVLRDPDKAMADSAVGRHLDRRAARLLTEPGFTDWARRVGEVIAGRDFPARRLREWRLVRAVVLGEPWTAEELVGASDWCRRTVAAMPAVLDPDALRLLAERGRTRRVRNAASRRTPPAGRPRAGDG